MDTNQNNQGAAGQNAGQAKPVSQLSWSQPMPAASSKGNSTQASKNNGTPRTPGNSKGLSSGVIVAFIVGLVIGFIIGWVWFGMKNSPNTETPINNDGTTQTDTDNNNGGTEIPTSTSTDETGGMTSVTSESASLTVSSPQTAGMNVAVATLSIDAPMWAVVYENVNGVPGKALGAARFTSDKTSGTISLLRSTLPNLEYFVGLTSDTPDHTFSIKINAPVVDADGNRILQKFTAQ